MQVMVRPHAFDTHFQLFIVAPWALGLWVHVLGIADRLAPIGVHCGIRVVSTNRATYHRYGPAVLGIGCCFFDQDTTLAFRAAHWCGSFLVRG